jgi:hypothetical protein
MNDTQKDAFLHNLYYVENYKVGRDNLFYYVSKVLKNEDISRRYIMKWLSNQTVHQLYSFRKPATDIRPSISSKPGSILQIDLIDFSKNRDDGYGYILNVIDIFSKKLWLEPIRNKDVVSVIPELNAVIQEIQRKHTIRIIQSDGGGEFAINFPVIKHITSRAATPQQQGIVERSNRTVKNILYKIQHQHNTKKWIEYLDDIVKVYNSTLNRSIGMTPDEAYNLNQDHQAELHQKVKDSKAQSFKNIDTVLKVGQKVRTVVPELAIRKKGLPTYSTVVYTIVKVIKGHTENITIPRYKIADPQGHLVENTFAISSLLVLPSNYHE